MSKKVKYWKGIEDLNNSPEFIKSSQNEFSEPIPADQFLNERAGDNNATPRRDFLKLLGFSVTAATLASCETPIRKAIPYLFKPEEITPGVSNWYASTYFDGLDYCGILVKTREGRPIKIEGNKQCKITSGGTNARVQASVLSLYDGTRISDPMMDGAKSSWEEVDKAIISKLNSISASNGNIRIVTASNASPSTKKAIAEFSTKYPTTKVVTYNPVSFSGIRKANEMYFGKSVIPNFRFDNAKTIVSFANDFLINWISPIEHARQFGMTRKAEAGKEMSRFYAFESNLSVTGSNADVRVTLKPSMVGPAIISLHNEIAGLSGGQPVGKGVSDEKVLTAIKMAAKELWNNKGKSLVVAGSNNSSYQAIINGINEMLGNYGNTIFLDDPSLIHEGHDQEIIDLIGEMKSGQVGALFIYNVNPAYSLPTSLGFGEALSKVGLSVSFSDRPDETSSLVKFVCPDRHFLESWNDYLPKAGHYALSQPVIAPLFNSRQAQDSLLVWAGNPMPYYDFMVMNWEQSMFPLQKDKTFFTDFWNQSLHDGIFEVKADQPVAIPEESKSKKTTKTIPPLATEAAEMPVANRDLSSQAQAIGKYAGSTGEFELMLYQKAAIGNGNQANNPWLQEMPDPVSRICWDNYLTMSPKQVEDMKLTLLDYANSEGSLVSISFNGTTMKVPVFPQPGQAYGTVGLALGYGRIKAGKAADNVGVNAYQLVNFSDGNFNYEIIDFKIIPSEGKHNFASTQTHHTLMGRSMVKETTFNKYKKDPSSGNEKETFSVKVGHEHLEKSASELDLWATPEQPGYDKPGHFWSMGIDLNSCFGCGACVIACQAENNIPVVGKSEIRKSREMHWIRIDRYYSSDAGKDDLSGMEVPSYENPKVTFQPLMCMHCNHAPCETVCPVIATSHSSEGLNQMTYNRCVGTRYCANNCPYKVRRFNWFKYSDNDQFDFNMNDDIGKMVLNPDVVVRSRGVIEKCSMCVQRIQEGKLTAKKEGRKIKDGEFLTACAQSCPTNAISFGDINNSETIVHKQNQDERRYLMLEELNTQPSVFYLTKVRNSNIEEA